MRRAAFVVGATCARRKWVGELRRHVYEQHLPWFYAPELACWLCEAAERSSMQVVSHHGVCEDGLFEGSRLSAWLKPWEESWNTWFLCLASNPKKDCWKWLWGRDFPPWMAMSTFLQPRNLLENAQGRKVKGILAICPPSCPSAMLSWTSLSQLLSRMTESQRLEVWNWEVSPTKWDTLMASAIDAHCHLRMMADRLKCSPEGTLSVCRQRHWSTEICSISWVVSNCVFPEAWNNPPTLTAPEQMLVETQVAFTYGVHPKTEQQVIPWPLLERKIQELECVAVGESGLDWTSQNPLGRQKDVFTRQMKMAAKYGKPLVLHLRNGKNLKLDVFETALQMAQKVLPRKQKVYLHSFTGTLDMFTRWQHRFVDILAGLSWLSLQGEEGETLARSLPFECLALESDAPHLSPLTTDMNSPWLLCHHAQVVARARNLPATVVLERAVLNTARFYGLEDDWDVHGWLGLYYSLFGFAVMVGPIVLDTFTGLPVACLIDPLMHPNLGSLSWLGPYCGLHRIVICFIIAVPWLGSLLWWGPYCGLHWAVIFYCCPKLGSRVPVGLNFIGCFYCGWSTIVSYMSSRFAVTGWA